MKAGNYYTLAKLTAVLNCSYAGLVELVAELDLKAVFSINDVPHFDEAAKTTLDDVMRDRDIALYEAAGAKVFNSAGKRLTAKPRNGAIKAAAGPAELIIGGGEIELQASAGDGPVKVKLLAYSGGIMAVGGFGNVLIDLAGMSIPASVPLLAEHDSSLAGAIGSVVAVTDGGKLLASGSIVREADQAGKILALARGGMTLQASVGAQPTESRMIRPGESVTVNGRTIQASREFQLITKSTLREISVVAVGADVDTSVSIAATRQGKPMSEFSSAAIGGEEVDPQVQSERTRVSGIAKLQAKYPTAANVAGIIAAGIEQGQTADQVELQLLRHSRPGVPNVMTGSRTGSVEARAVFGAAILAHIGKETVAEKVYSAETMERSRRLHKLHSMDLVRACLANDNIEADGMTRDEMVRAALSSLTMPLALGDVVQRSIETAYKDSPATWRDFCAIRPAADFRTQTSFRPSFAGQLEEVASDSELKHTSVSEEQYSTWKITTFGKMLGLSRVDVVNDNLGALADVAGSMGRMGMRGLNDQVWGVLMANASSWFGTAHKNYLSGADSVLSVASLSAAFVKLMTMRDKEGNCLDIRPSVLAVPPELNGTAKSILNSEWLWQDVSGLTGGTPSANPVRESLKLVTEPRLSNTDSFTGASDVAFYVLGSAADAPLVVGFLDGQQTPTVEALGMQATPNKLEYVWRIYFDHAAALNDWRAAVKSKGAV